MTTIPTKAEYERNELADVGRMLREVESEPLADRQAARAEWAEAMTHPKLVAERVSWLLAGNYGYGACLWAKRVKANKRCNRVAQIGQLIAALEWRCPPNFAAEAWNKLTQAQQTNVNAAVRQAIETTEVAVD